MTNKGAMVKLIMVMGKSCLDGIKDGIVMASILVKNVCQCQNYCGGGMCRKLLTFTARGGLAKLCMRFGGPVVSITFLDPGKLA